MQIHHYTLASQYQAQSEALFNEAYHIVEGGSPNIDQLERAAECISKSIERLSMAIHIYENTFEADMYNKLIHNPMHKRTRLQGIILYNLDLMERVETSPCISFLEHHA